MTTNNNWGGKRIAEGHDNRHNPNMLIRDEKMAKNWPPLVQSFVPIPEEEYQGWEEMRDEDIYPGAYLKRIKDRKEVK